MILRHGVVLTKSLVLAAIFTFLCVSPVLTQVEKTTTRIDARTENGVTIERHYDDSQVFFMSVERSSEGGTLVERVTNSVGQLIQISRTTETHALGDSAEINRHITIKKYEPGSRRPVERIVRDEVEGLLNLAPFIKQRVTTIRRYSRESPHALVEVETEEFQLVHIDENGVPIYEGARKLKNNDGESISAFSANNSSAETENFDESRKTIPDKVLRMVRDACESIPASEEYGLISGPFNFEGDWNAVTTAALQPFYDSYQETMSDKRDGADFTFGQVNGFYKRLAYSTLIKAANCSLTVLRHSRHFPDNDVRQARTTACDLRGFLGSILQEEEAQTVGDWRPVLLEMDDLDPCN